MNLLLTEQLPVGVSERKVCDVLDVCRNSLRAARARYHFCGPISPHRRKCKAARQPRALSAAEQMVVRDVLTSEAYCDQPPRMV